MNSGINSSDRRMNKAELTLKVFKKIYKRNTKYVRRTRTRTNSGKTQV
jgi:hypothetical protein